MPAVPAWLADSLRSQTPQSYCRNSRRAPWAGGPQGRNGPKLAWVLLGGAGQLSGTCFRSTDSTVSTPSHAGMGLVSKGIGEYPSSLPVLGLHTGCQVQMDKDCSGPTSPLWEEQQPTAPKAHDRSQASKVRLQDGVPRAGLRVVSTCSRGTA